MQTRMWQLTSGLTLALISFGLGGCQFLNGEKSSEANPSSNVVTPESQDRVIEPADKVVKLDSKSKPVSISVSPLTRPTDPDARVKAVQKGRSNPFAALVSGSALSSREGAQQEGGGSVERSSTITVNNVTTSAKPSILSGTPSALGTSKSTTVTRVAAKPQPRSTELPNLESAPPQLSGGSGSGETVVLPPLPEATLAKQVSVQGVMLIAGQPRAIIKAPDESVTRTVMPGDYLSKGQILVSAIDMSNPQNPVVVLQESGQTVSIGVGKSAETMTASLPF